MKQVFVDTNIFLRYLIGDDPVRYNKCRDIFKKAIDGKISLLTSDMVIAELIWTLRSFYKIQKSEIIEKVSIIISTPGLHIPNKNLLSEALLLYSIKNIDYIDSYNAIFMKHHNTSEIYSYDSDFDNIGGIERTGP